MCAVGMTVRSVDLDLERSTVSTLIDTMKQALYLCLSLWTTCLVLAENVPHLKVAIVGSGIAGASSAYFVRASYPNASITMFERDEIVGGRTRTIPFGPAGLTTVDAGATSISTLNQYLMQFVSELGLHRKAESSGPNDMLGIWDGDQFAYESHEDWRLPVTAALRYGFSPVHMIGAVRDAVDRLGSVYQQQAAGIAWGSPKQMFESLGLYNLTQVEAYSFFDQLGVAPAFTRQFIDGASRDNYNQPGTLNAFVDLVSLAGAGISGKVFELENGTTSLPIGLISSANVTAVHMNTTVYKINRKNSSIFEVLSKGDRGEKAESFDAVILATPLEFTSIELPVGISVPQREYQQTYATFVAGKLSTSFFGRNDFDTILTVENTTIPFSCIGQHGELADGTHIYKVFSRSPLDDAVLDSIFEERGHTQHVAWNATGAYPKLLPTHDWPSFELAPGLIYVNAMESAVSCMETEIIAAKNAELLLARR